MLAFSMLIGNRTSVASSSSETVNRSLVQSRRSQGIAAFFKALVFSCAL